MRWYHNLLALCAALLVAAEPVHITGAGATFPYPLYAKWAEIYQSQTQIQVNYQSIGSSGGIKQIQLNTVDFAASDIPMTPEALQKNNLIQFPTVVGGIVPVVNLPDVLPGQLKLTPTTLANIFLGKIKYWNDPAIVALNPKLPLTKLKIKVVRRADGSGTTFLFTDYLSKISPEWQQQVGTSTAVRWPVGIGGKGNDGVAAYVQRLKGAIGYVEFVYAKQNQLSFICLQNQQGHFVTPDKASFQAAASRADWLRTPGFHLILTNQSGENTWPIVGATFILMQKQQMKPKTAKEVLKFFDWAYENGAPTALELDYVLVPPPIVAAIKASWQQLSDENNMPLFSK